MTSTRRRATPGRVPSSVDRGGALRPAAAIPRQPIGGLRRAKRQEALAGLLFIAPNFFGLLVFLLFPIAASLALSFTEWDLVSEPEFVGLANYSRMLEDKQFWNSLNNTVLFAAMTIPLTVIVSLSLALAVERIGKGVLLYRSAFFLPVIASVVSVGIVWRWVYNREFGVLNYALDQIGVAPQAWLSSASLVMPSLVLVAVWKSMGFNMVLFLAGLRAIPRELLEAAQVDGASYWQTLRWITLPLLTPTLLFVTVMTVIASFQVFDLVFVMTGGGPGDASRVYYYHLWQNAFRFFRMGYASAMAWVLFGILFGLTLLQMRIIGRRVTYEIA